MLMTPCFSRWQNEEIVFIHIYYAIEYFVGEYHIPPFFVDGAGTVDSGPLAYSHTTYLSEVLQIVWLFFELFLQPVHLL